MAENPDPGGSSGTSDEGEQHDRMTADIPPCHCVICAEAGVPDSGAEGGDVPADSPVPGWFGEAAAHVRKTGWTSIGIMPGIRTPGWAFSVGLWHSYRAAEVSIFGLLLPDMQQRINRAALIRDNKPFGIDIEIDGILDAQPVIAKRVHPAWYATLFGFGVGFYRGAVPPFVQLVWPDSRGSCPGSRAAARGAGRYSRSCGCRPSCIRGGRGRTPSRGCHCCRATTSRATASELQLPSGAPTAGRLGQLQQLDQPLRLGLVQTAVGA